jgi:hypothetical protein
LRKKKRQNSDLTCGTCTGGRSYEAVEVALSPRDIGAFKNVIEASWHALVDSVEYKLSEDRLNRNEDAA